MKLGGAVIYTLALTASTVLFTPCLGDYLSKDNLTHCLFEIAEIDSVFNENSLFSLASVLNGSLLETSFYNLAKQYFTGDYCEIVDDLHEEVVSNNLTRR